MFENPLRLAEVSVLFLQPGTVKEDPSATSRVGWVQKICRGIVQVSVGAGSRNGQDGRELAPLHRCREAPRPSGAS